MESFGGNYDSVQTQERNNEQVVSSLNDSRNDIQRKAIGYYETNKNDLERVQTLKDFIDKQESDRNNLRENLERPVLQETREQLDREAMINEAKIMLYEKLGINDNLESNNWGENFAKGIVDTLILDNYDLAIQVWETNGAVIIDSIKELFSSWENIKKLAEALGDSVMGLFSGDGYQTGKSAAELGLITTGVGAPIAVGKKSMKLGIKQISKLRKRAERVIESSSVKKVIGETTKQAQEIIPKKELDIEAVVKKRVDIQKKIEGLEKLGFPESISKDILESGLLNEKFYGGDLLKRFQALENKGIDYNTLVDDMIKQIPNLTKEEALLIFTYTDNTIYRSLNSFMRGDKNVLEGMTKENIEASRKLALKLERAIEKMPNLEGGKNGFILRGDKLEWWKGDVGDNIELKSFTSVANNRNDIFIGEGFDNDAIVLIIGKEGRIKDISGLAIAVNFGDKLKGITKTSNEGLILPKSTVKIIGREVKKESGVDITNIKVEQIK